jgi:hypothetical protein
MFGESVISIPCELSEPSLNSVVKFHSEGKLKLTPYYEKLFVEALLDLIL